MGMTHGCLLFLASKCAMYGEIFGDGAFRTGSFGEALLAFWEQAQACQAGLARSIA